MPCAVLYPCQPLFTSHCLHLPFGTNLLIFNLYLVLFSIYNIFIYKYIYRARAKIHVLYSIYSTETEWGICIEFTVYIYILMLRKKEINKMI